MQRVINVGKNTTYRKYSSSTVCGLYIYKAQDQEEIVVAVFFFAYTPINSLQSYIKSRCRRKFSAILMPIINYVGWELLIWLCCYAAWSINRYGKIDIQCLKWRCLFNWFIIFAVSYSIIITNNMWHWSSLLLAMCVQLLSCPRVCSLWHGPLLTFDVVTEGIEV